MGEINYLHNSKLVKLLGTSDKKEQKRFEGYINTPFFNKHKDVIALWKFIKKRLPSFSKIPTEKELLKALYANEGEQVKKWTPKEDTQLRISMNRLTGLFYDFLIYQRNQTEEVRNRRLLMDELMGRKLYKQIPAILKSTWKIHNKNPHRHPQYYSDEYLLHEMDFFFNVINRNRNPTSHSGEVIKSLSDYALSNLMLYYASYMNSTTIMHLSEDIPLADKLVEHIECNKKNVSQIVIVYYHIYMIVTEQEPEKHYYELKEILKDFQRHLPKTPLRFIYTFMINFCVKKIKRGDIMFRTERHEIYQNLLPFGIWDTELAFSPHHYIGHLTNMLHLKKYEPAIEFQTAYQPKLQAKYIPDIPNLGYAYYYFHTGDYEQAQDYLNQVIDREDFMYTLYCKRLLIQIYYEKQEWISIESALEALRFYLLPERTKSISEQIRTYNKNFLSICRKILRQRNNAEYDKASANILQKIKAEIQDKKTIAEREWLLAKVEELIQ